MSGIQYGTMINVNKGEDSKKLQTLQSPISIDFTSLSLIPELSLNTSEDPFDPNYFFILTVMMENYQGD